jgi:hypothetical protein
MGVQLFHVRHAKADSRISQFYECALVICFCEGNLEVISTYFSPNRWWKHRKHGKYKEYELSTYDSDSCTEHYQIYKDWPTNALSCRLLYLHDWSYIFRQNNAILREQGSISVYFCLWFLCTQFSVPFIWHILTRLSHRQKLNLFLWEGAIKDLNSCISIYALLCDFTCETGLNYRR